MSMENPHFTLHELFVAFHQTPEMSRPVWRASFDICCMAWELDPKREWERQCRSARNGDRALQ